MHIQLLLYVDNAAEDCMRLSTFHICTSVVSNINIVCINELKNKTG